MALLLVLLAGNRGSCRLQQPRLQSNQGYVQAEQNMLHIALADTSMHPYQARKSLTDYKNLPCPVKYEELQREALSMSLTHIMHFSNLQVLLSELQIVIPSHLPARDCWLCQ